MPSAVKVHRTLIYGCMHLPYQDKRAEEILLDFVKYWKPTRIISNGDGNDLWKVSRYFKFPERQTNLQDEADESRRFHTELRRAAKKDCEIIYNYGNHEYRYDAYLASNAPEVATLRDLSFEKQFGLVENGIAVNKGHRGNYARTKVGPFVVGHFEIARAHSAYTENALVTSGGTSIIASHSHRKGVFYKTLMDGTVLQGIGTGHMCDESQADYVETPNWQKGFVTIEKIAGKNRYFASDINIVGGNLLFEGRLF